MESETPEKPKEPKWKTVLDILSVIAFINGILVAPVYLETIPNGTVGANGNPPPSVGLTVIAMLLMLPAGIWLGNRHPNLIQEIGKRYKIARSPSFLPYSLVALGLYYLVARFIIH